MTGWMGYDFAKGTAAEIGKEQGESRNKVFRYIRLTHLIPELLQKVDEGGIALSPAVELSYLSEEQQKILLDAMRLNDCTPSHAQSIRMKKAAQQGTPTPCFSWTTAYRVQPSKDQILCVWSVWQRTEKSAQSS